MKIIVFDVGGTAIKYGMMDGNFDLIFSGEIPTQEFIHKENMVMAALESKLDEFKGRYDAIGVSTAGQINYAEGAVLGGVGNIPNYYGSEIRKTFEEKYGVPVAVDNDVNCAGLGEAHFGAGRGYDDFLCLTYGTGLGGCIYQNGDVYRGSRFAAGEFGHMVTHATGKQCTCGRTGCYEAYASCSAFTNAVSERMGRPMNGREIFEPENIVNPIILEELDKWEDEIAVGLRSLCYIFNPTLIILGGGIMSEDLIVDGVREKLYKQIEKNYLHVRVVKAQLKNKAGMYGAAWLANEKLKKAGK